MHSFESFFSIKICTENVPSVKRNVIQGKALFKHAINLGKDQLSKGENKSPPFITETKCTDEMGFFFSDCRVTGDFMLCLAWCCGVTSVLVC